MKQCCLCGKSGHESSECSWHRAVPMSKVGHATFTVKDEVSHAIKEANRCHCKGCGISRYGHGYQPCKFSSPPSNLPPRKP